MKKCSQCKQELKKVIYKGVSVDECPQCLGMFFEKNELEMAKNNTDEDLRWVDFVIFENTPNKFIPSDSNKMCPACNSSMKGFTYKDSKVTLDVCSQCEGVWLDKGEFQKIIAYLEKLIISESASEYAKDVLQQFREIANGNEDMIREIKDFLAVLKLFEMRLVAEHPKVSEMIQAISITSPLR